MRRSRRHSQDIRRISRSPMLDLQTDRSHGASLHALRPDRHLHPPCASTLPGVHLRRRTWLSHLCVLACRVCLPTPAYFCDLLSHEGLRVLSPLEHGVLTVWLRTPHRIFWRECNPTLVFVHHRSPFIPPPLLMYQTSFIKHSALWSFFASPSEGCLAKRLGHPHH